MWGDRVAGNIYTGNNDRQREYPEDREVRVRYVGDLDIRCKRGGFTPGLALRLAAIYRSIYGSM